MSTKITRFILGVSAAVMLVPTVPASSFAIPPQSSGTVQIVPVVPPHDNQNSRYPTRTWKVVQAPYMKSWKMTPGEENFVRCSAGYNPDTGQCW
jgi:hypothetical protein